MNKKARNQWICEHFLLGVSQKNLAMKFSLSQPRIHQILKRAGVMKPKITMPSRTRVNVYTTPEVKDAITQYASDAGLSVTSIAEEMIREGLAARGMTIKPYVDTRARRLPFVDFSKEVPEL